MADNEEQLARARASPGAFQSWKNTDKRGRLLGRRRGLITAALNRNGLTATRNQIIALARTRLMLDEWATETSRKMADSYTNLYRLYRQQLADLGLTEADLG